MTRSGAQCVDKYCRKGYIESLPSDMYSHLKRVPAGKKAYCTSCKQVQKFEAGTVNMFHQQWLGRCRGCGGQMRRSITANDDKLLTYVTRPFHQNDDDPKKPKKIENKKSPNGNDDPMSELDQFRPMMDLVRQAFPEVFQDIQQQEQKGRKRVDPQNKAVKFNPTFPETASESDDEHSSDASDNLDSEGDLSDDEGESEEMLGETSSEDGDNVRAVLSKEEEEDAAHVAEFWENLGQFFREVNAPMLEEGMNSDHRDNGGGGGMMLIDQGSFGNKAGHFASMQVGPKMACLDPERIKKPDKNVYHFRLGRSCVMNQFNTGRCWMFAGLNLIRITLAEKMGVPNFELSTSYLFYYDKLERSRYVLQKMEEFVGKTDFLDRELNFWIKEPLSGDGGHFSYFANLVNKYGVVPDSVMKNTFNSNNSKDMNEIISHILRKSMLRIITKQSTFKQEWAMVLPMVRRVLRRTIGVPPKKFAFEWNKENKKDKNKPIDSWGEMTPLQLWKRCGIDFSNMVVLVNDPRHPMKKYMRMEKINNMVKTPNFTPIPVEMLNVPLDVLKMATKATMMEYKMPVYMACDVAKQSNVKLGIMDGAMYRYDWLFGSDYPEMSREESLLTLDGGATHAMLFTGLHFDARNEVDGYLVENSWGNKDASRMGYMHMDPNWWESNMWEVVVPISAVPAKYIPTDHSFVSIPVGDPLFALRK